MCYSGYKGTIKRAKKQKYFGFSEREYLRRQFKGTIKRAKKQKYFGFSKREYLRDVFPKVRLTPNRSLAHNSPVIVPAIAQSSILFPCIKARACLVFVQVVMSQDQGIWIFLLKVLYKQQQGFFLFFRSGVCRIAKRIQSALVAYAY